MKKSLLSLAMFGLAFIGSKSFAGETYESEEARLKITFPGEYEIEREEDEETGTITFSLSCSYGDMLLIGNVFIYTEGVSEDDNLYQEGSEVLRICNAFGSKFNAKYITNWSVEEDTGLISSLKCSGDFKGYIGNYYVLIQDTFEWQFLVLGFKKSYDHGAEARFINSFEILD